MHRRRPSHGIASWDDRGRRHRWARVSEMDGHRNVQRTAGDEQPVRCVRDGRNRRSLEKVAGHASFWSPGLVSIHHRFCRAARSQRRAEQIVAGIIQISQSLSSRIDSTGPLQGRSVCGALYPSINGYVYKEGRFHACKIRKWQKKLAAGGMPFGGK